MIKAFLSHSSKDKDSYVRPVANWLGKENIIYDEFTFEEGEKNLDLILEGLEESELFVIFISENSLSSKWVKREISESKKIIDSGKLLRILPIVIDNKIKYDDKRIPKWLREEYNLRPITRCKTAADKIKTKLMKLCWDKHPRLEKINSLFVGRNDQLEEFEERINNYEKSKPIVISTSGLIGVGRRTFLSNALIKCNIKKNNILPTYMYLDRNESIEDFILKLNDLGLIDLKTEILNLSDKTIEEKKNIIIKILIEAYKANETIFLIDDGCIINYKREITDWFKGLIQECNEFNYPIICLASRYKVPFKNRPRNDKFYFIELPELNIKERKWLLTQLLNIENINDLSADNFNNICDYLTGLPEQVKYAVELIKDKNIIPFEEKIPILVSFNNERAALLLNRYSDDNEILDFIRLLAQFEVITIDFIFSIVDRHRYTNILNNLLSESICELIGSDGEMIRLNDIIRDYIKRNRIEITDEYNKKIEQIVKKTIENETLTEINSSVYIFTLKERLKKDEQIDSKLLIPSHYLRCMKDLYNSKGSLDKVISLADRILQKEKNMENRVTQDIRYYLCLALAKKSDSRLLQEVQKIQGVEHKFLLAFYYRKCGRIDDALQLLLEIINEPYIESRAKRELVQVYTQLEEFDQALDYAKRNFSENKNNQFHCQAYFQCLINSHNISKQDVEILKNLIERLIKINSEQSIEMAKTSQALFFSKIENNLTKAIATINNTIVQYPNSPYPLLAKFDIGLRHRNIDILKESLQPLEMMQKKRIVSDKKLTTYKAYLLALDGHYEDAIDIIKKALSKYPVSSNEKIMKKIYEYSHANKT
jgi:tetratricopeptide (TPR) repeat protein